MGREKRREGREIPFQNQSPLTVPLVQVNLQRQLSTELACTGRPRMGPQDPSLSPKVAGGCTTRRAGTTNENHSSPQWLYLCCSHGPLPFLLASPLWAEFPGQEVVEKWFPGSCLHPFHIPGKPWWSDVPELSPVFPTMTSLLPPASTLRSLVSLQGLPPAMGYLAPPHP